jgi:hypothetical protein
LESGVFPDFEVDSVDEDDGVEDDDDDDDLPFPP